MTERAEPPAEPERHVCGLTGFNPMIDPPCPGCASLHESFTKDESAVLQQAINAGVFSHTTAHRVCEQPGCIEEIPTTAGIIPKCFTHRAAPPSSEATS